MMEKRNSEVKRMIRPMTANDMRQVQQIVRTTWQETYDNLIPESLQARFLESAYSDSMLLKRMEKTRLLVLQYDENLIGFINFTETDADGDAELLAIHVLPNFQRNGFGKRLVQAMQEMLVNTLQLFTYIDERNRNSRQFYEKEGFQLLQVFDEHFEGLPVQTAEYVYHYKNF